MWRFRSFRNVRHIFRESRIRKSLRMNRLRRSFRKKEHHVPECSRPHQWQEDEKKVRAGSCHFAVKYLGGLEVTESRGMSVCEEAVRKLRESGKKKIRALLWVSGDGLRVVDDSNKGLLVDQTIEKVSFCAPARNHDRAFSYICRDGTTRRWLCHSFIALKDPGERLSHAVGCAFAICLEKKQKRDKECGVKVDFDVNKTTFTRHGSFREATMTEKLEQQQKSDQHLIFPSAEIHTQGSSFVENPPNNPHALPRRHATASLLQRQASVRGLSNLNKDQSPFKRQLSLKLNELPSTLQRRDLKDVPEVLSPTSPTSPKQDPPPDSISSMCQKISAGMMELTGKDPFDDFHLTPEPSSHTQQSHVQPSAAVPIRQESPWDNNGLGPGPKTRTGTNHWNQSSHQIQKQKSEADAWLDSSSTLNPFQSKSSSEFSSKQQDFSSQTQVSRVPITKSYTIDDPFLPQDKSTGFQPLNSQMQKMGQFSNGFDSSSPTITSSTFQKRQQVSDFENFDQPSDRNSFWAQQSGSQGQPKTHNGVTSQINDPFESQWNSISSRSNNPFSNAVKTFEINL